MMKKFRYIFRRKRTPGIKSRRYLRNPGHPRTLRIPRITSAETKKCQFPSCGVTTKEGKPYCPDHIEHHPYVAKLLAELAGKKEEEEKVAKKGRSAITGDSITLQEVLTHVQNLGARTVERIARELNLNAKVVIHYARQLRSQGKVKLTKSKRGTTVVSPVNKRHYNRRRYR